MKYNCFIILLFCAYSCSEAPLDTTESNIYSEGYFNRPFQINVGERALFASDNFKIGFDSVLTDSRCPIGVVCYWEGEALLKLWLRKDRSDKKYFRLLIRGYVWIEDTLNHRYIDTMGYRIKLMQLDPYPVHGIFLDYNKYRATFLVNKIEH